MFRSLLSKTGATLKRTTTAVINGQSSYSSLLAPPAKYFLRNQNPNVLVESRVTSIFFNSFSTTTASNDLNVHASDSGSLFVVSYLINSCGLTQDEAVTASKKLHFTTKSQPDSVLNSLKNYGFTESHISNVISKVPTVLQYNPSVTLQPKLDFFLSKGFEATDLADVISSFPGLIARGLSKEIVPSFDLLKSVVQSDENVIQMIKNSSWVINIRQVQRMMVNVEHLRNEGVPEANIIKHLIEHPRAYTADKFEEIVEKVKEMGFDPLEITFLKAVHMLRIMSEDNLRKKMDDYKRLGGWSEDQIQSAFRKNPTYLKVSEKKIELVMNFLVNEMNYDSSIVAENTIVFTSSLQGRIMPRCSVSRVLVSRGLIKDNISLSELSTMSDESFLETFVTCYEQEVPGLMKVFEGQLNYQELLQN